MIVDRRNVRRENPEGDVPRESADSVFDEVSGWGMEGRSSIKSHPRVIGNCSYPYRSGML